MAVILALVLYYSFDFDLPLYYKHFFGTYTAASGHGHRTYAHASPIWFFGSLLNPTANLDNLKGGPVLWALALYLVFLENLPPRTELGCCSVLSSSRLVRRHTSLTTMAADNGIMSHL